MNELRATPTFTTEQLDRDALTAIVARSVLEAALAEDESAELWFDVESNDEDVSRLSIDLSPSDMEQLLGLSSEDEIALTIDGEAIENLFADAEVEAHGLKAAIAIAVTGAAILVPTAQSAVTQGAGAASRPQVIKAAMSAETHPAAKVQVVNAATHAQVIGAATKTQVSRTLVVRASGFRFIRGELAR
jgi:hypothetical protein